MNRYRERGAKHKPNLSATFRKVKAGISKEGQGLDAKDTHETKGNRRMETVLRNSERTNCA